MFKKLWEWFLGLFKKSKKTTTVRGGSGSGSKKYMK